MKTIFIDGDIRVGRVNFKYKEEDSDNVYCQLGYYHHRGKERNIVAVKQRHFDITAYIILHEFMHMIIDYILKGKKRRTVDRWFDRLDFYFKKYILRYRPKQEMIENI